MLSVSQVVPLLNSINNVEISSADIENLNDNFIQFLKDNINSVSSILEVVNDVSSTPSIFLNHNTVLNSLNSIIPIKSSKKGYI